MKKSIKIEDKYNLKRLPSEDTMAKLSNYFSKNQTKGRVQFLLFAKPWRSNRFSNNFGFPIHVVTIKGEPIYTDKIKGHFIWDIDPNKCGSGCECYMHDNDFERDIILLKEKNKEMHKPYLPPHMIW